jgi:hypothetical protein
MRKLGPAQHTLLKLISDRYALICGNRVPAGLTKGHMFASDWRIADRLMALGLVEERFVRGEGPTYFATEPKPGELSVKGKSLSMVFCSRSTL